MKRVVTCLLALLFGMLLVISTTAQEEPKAEDIPVAVEAEFPAAVEMILLDEAVIAPDERVAVKAVESLVDSCEKALSADDTSLVTVNTDLVLKIPALKKCSTVECTKDYVYATLFDKGITYEWLYFLDGKVQKNVSYDYEERTADFAMFKYTIVNHDNQSLEKSRMEIELREASIDVADFLFGMAIAFLLMMIAVVIVRMIKRPG